MRVGGHQRAGYCSYHFTIYYSSTLLCFVTPSNKYIGNSNEARKGKQLEELDGTTEA